MIEIGANRICLAFYGLKSLGDALAIEMSHLGSNSLLSDKSKKALSEILPHLSELCALLQLKSSNDRVFYFLLLLEKSSERPLFSSVALNEIHSLASLIIKESHSVKAAVIPVEKTKFFERPKLFGKEVYDQFKSARYDVREAGNCLATGAYTATVFHLMRVAEFGLRSLAEHFDIKYLGKRVANKPLELCGWEEVIRKIEEKIEAKFGPTKATPKIATTVLPTSAPLSSPTPKPKKRSDLKKDEDKEFYRGVIGEFYAFKDIWRNRVMHTRRSYNDAEALGVFIRVEDFMRRLSTRLREVK